MRYIQLIVYNNIIVLVFIYIVKRLSCHEMKLADVAAKKVLEGKEEERTLSDFGEQGVL